MSASSRIGNPQRWLESLLQDVRYGLRMLWKDRAAMAAAAISLSLSLGA